MRSEAIPVGGEMSCGWLECQGPVLRLSVFDVLPEKTETATLDVDEGCS